MARPSIRPAVPRLRQRLRAYRWRRVGLLAAGSLASSLALVAYLFGGTDHFITRSLTAFLTGFCLLAVTFMGILPFIGWATTHWFGPGWVATDAPRARRPAGQPARPLAARSTTTT